ncbi:MAG: IS21 family transposase, partial [Pseudomonadales bacterium]|nr:IS21 family transposase [Pseudomonadales bacterium]
LLRRFGNLKAPKVLRKLKAKDPDLNVSERSLRRYLHRLRPIVAAAQTRYYEPIIDEVPGVQCQVDGGELRDVPIGGVSSIVYFVVFVLSYSRLMYVSLSRKPIDTEQFIRMHDAAFRYFGGIPEECVYDQTKLVVIEERYREVTFNERFYQYASQAGMDIRVCEGYDPESKGKVESGVKYVKGDCLYGEVFADWTALEVHLRTWLDEVANERVHGTTGKVPVQVYDQRERQTMRPYESAHLPLAQCTRKADKTGLISFKANKYSVPLAYQQSTVQVEVINDQLVIREALGSLEIARHPLQPGKGQIIKNTDHYRDTQARIADYEARVRHHTGEEHGRQLCGLLKQTSPKIYKDQLRAVINILSPVGALDAVLLDRLVERPRLTATQLRDYVMAYQHNPEGFERSSDSHTSAAPELLSRYASLTEQHRGVTR